MTLQITDENYLEIRNNIASRPDNLLAAERRYMILLTEIVLKAAPQIVADFDRAIELLPFWINYQPMQRGCAYLGTSIPWSEVAETAIGANILRALCLSDLPVKFPGL